MDHFYEKVDGWFSHYDKQVYDDAVNQFADGDIFVEIGSFKGRSASAMAVNIINSQKDIKFYCVDTWKGSEEHQKGQNSEDKDVVDGTLLDVFKYNIRSVKNYINIIQKESAEAAKEFQDKSLSFVFIDASHDYENVKQDINSWYPKIKNGGILAGHDWFGEDIKKAVYEFCNEHNFTVIESSCWTIKI
jgi:hypothetical protein